MSYGPEWILGIGVTLAALLFVPFVGPAIALVAALLVAMAAVVALVGALAATPFLLIRSARRRLNPRLSGGLRWLFPHRTGPR